MNRALSFGAVATEYDALRPDYPAPLVADLVELLPGPRVAEIGAGTGKATAALVAAGLDVTCVEPDPAMAAVLAARTGRTAISATFEQWQPDGTFDGLVSAQAWHWTDPDGRYHRAAAALHPGGLLALFWNRHEPGGSPLYDRLDAVYAAHGVEPDERPVREPAGPDPWPGNEIRASPDFDYLGLRLYPWTRRYTAEDLVGYLNTTSQHRIMPAGQREALAAELVATIRRYAGETVELGLRTALYLGRRR